MSGDVIVLGGVVLVEKYYPPIVSPILGLVLGVFATFALLSGIADVILASRLYRRDPATVSEGLAADGGAEVEGTATATDGTTTAPFSGTETLYCVYRASARDGNDWDGLVFGTVGGPFTLRDHTGAVRIEPESADEHLETETWRADAGSTVDESVRDRLQSGPYHDETSDDIFDDDGRLTRELKLSESRTDPGDEIYIYGSVSHTGQQTAAVVENRRLRRFVLGDRPESSTLRSVAKSGAFRIAFSGAMFLGAYQFSVRSGWVAF